MSTLELESTIDEAFERRAEIAPGRVDRRLADALEHVIQELNAGRLRVAKQIGRAHV